MVDRLETLRRSTIFLFLTVSMSRLGLCICLNLIGIEEWLTFRGGKLLGNQTVPLNEDAREA